LKFLNNIIFSSLQIFHLLLCSFAIHIVRLTTSIYPVIAFSTKVFPVEVLYRIRFLSDNERGISTLQASRADTSDKKQSKVIFCGVAILSAVAIATDIAYNIFTETGRIGNTGISLLYYRKQRRAIFLVSLMSKFTSFLITSNFIKQ
uniref:CASP-like protein n=1 Tax=Onchocerca flexuosa TaxID=387005 RepID=A0A183HTE9_9BILA